MTSKTLTTIALMTGIVACGDGNKPDEQAALFAHATDEQIGSAITAAIGQDLSWVLFWVEQIYLGSIVTGHPPCYSVTEVEGGLQYQGTDTSDCGFHTGTITVYGADGPGSSHQGKTIDFDNVEFRLRWHDDVEATYFANGTVDEGTDYLEADLEHAVTVVMGVGSQTVDGFEIESHTSKYLEKDELTSAGDTVLWTHGPDSWATIPGLGSFDISGTVGHTRLEDGERQNLTSLQLTGADTLTINPSTRGCYTYEIDGESSRYGVPNEWCFQWASQSGR
jgi:hypothetical protein